MIYDLAVIGYGPTGMVMAALAGRLGLRTVVLEKHRGLYNLPRAACFDDEIMRLFQKLGLVEAILPGTVVQPDYQWVNADGQTLLEISYDDPAPAGWAALYMMYQPHIETVLDARCKALETDEVRQGAAVTSLVQREEFVELGHVRARFVVAADGGTSFVRAALGVGQSDYGFQENWLVCDFRKLHEVDVPTFRQVCDPAQPTSIVRIGPHHHRISFMLAPDEQGATDPRRVWERVARYLDPSEAELVRVANYTFRSRISERWRVGRVFLAGDAAHEMPPFLAQGMCSGMRDAHNLAWKLARVLRRESGDALLDTYQPEREPHVRFITEKAIELGRVQTLRDPVAARARDERLLSGRGAPEKIRYPALRGGVVGSGTGAGELFPQFERFDEGAGEAPWLVTWDVPGYSQWFAQRGCSAAVVRPDFYVYDTGDDADALLASYERALRP